MQRREVLVRSSRAAAAIPLLPLAALSSTRLETLIADWEKQIPKLMAETKCPGLSMAIILDGKLRWRRGFGVTDAASKKRVDSNTIFEAGSMSKPVFAYLVMKLAEKGTLHLDTPLSKYTPTP